MRTALVPLLLLLLGACATHSDQGRQRTIASSEVGTAYSEVEMQARLALTPETRCEEDDCIATQAFRTRVERLGERVGDGAYRLAFERDLPVPSFLVTVPGKDDIGTLSNASGSIVVFDGLRGLRLSDALLAFLIAREMGHVLARHHEENSATSIGISVAVSLLFPMTNILRGVEAAYATAATTASLASTAVSFAGSRIVRGLYRAEQQREADVYALAILGHAGWSPYEVSAALHAATPLLIGEGWMAELRETMLWLEQVAIGPPYPPPPEAEAPLVLTPLPLEEIPLVELVFVDLTRVMPVPAAKPALLPPCTPRLKKAGKPCDVKRATTKKRPGTRRGQRR